MQSLPDDTEDTLDYLEDEDVEDDNDDNANNNRDEEDDNDDDDQKSDDDDNTSATSEEEVGGDDRPGEWDDRQKEENIPFNFDMEMEMLCKRLSFTHGYDI